MNEAVANQNPNPAPSDQTNLTAATPQVTPTPVQVQPAQPGSTVQVQPSPVTPIQTKPLRPVQSTTEISTQASAPATPLQTPASLKMEEQMHAQLANSSEDMGVFTNIKLKISSFPLHKIVALLLILQALNGIAKSIKFIMIEYPELEDALVAGLVTQEQINNFAGKAVIMVTTTVISIFFAIRISVIQNKMMKRISTVMGILIFFGNTWINRYLEEIGSAKIITDTILSVFKILGRDVN